MPTLLLSSPTWIRAQPDPLHPLAEIRAGIEGLYQREVLPYVRKAWIDESGTKIGLEISFTRCSAEPEPLHPLAEIRGDRSTGARERNTGFLRRGRMASHVDLSNGPTLWTVP